MSPTRLGFVGLGAMGGPMAANIAAAGFDLTVYDKAGTQARAPAEAHAVESLAEVAAVAETIFLSLPKGADSLAVVRDIAAVETRAVTTVIDLSTVGIEAAAEAHGILAAAGLAYIDAPVSGGQAGARAGTITVIWAGPRQTLEDHRPVLMAMCKNPFHVGERAGQGQALKLLNNFLSATAMAATSEAILFGLSQGLDMKTMLDVVNVSTGQNTASRDKFPKRILSGTYDAGFTTTLLSKDVSLYLESVRKAETAADVGGVVADLWRRCDDAMPGSDITRVFDFARDRP